MRKIVVCTNLSLDGVMQGPARADEDPRGGFTQGGWATPYAAMTEVGQVFGSADALLLGRRTYDDFYSVWPKRAENSMSGWLERIPKYVVSRTPTTPLPWASSTLLQGEATAAIKALKTQPGKDILVMGSGELLRSVIGAGVIDEYVLLIHPLVLGAGTRLFGSHSSAVKLSLVSSTTTKTGVVVAIYHPAATHSEELLR